MASQKLVYLLDAIVGGDFAQRVNAYFEALQFLMDAGFLIGVLGFRLGFYWFLGHGAVRVRLRLVHHFTQTTAARWRAAAEPNAERPANGQPFLINAALSGFRN
ncbi:hypothetical protein BEN47_18030 [Hymenobacter lapidarius]|uniref:Uncharacterized protein n=1 Tax=Hymenobacter lapidarius TaxID=1908237 RepID=A0A1G1SWB7_9BACT|nr:hypothetical protein BEN47_18030 [Hymenobacter lapidarius]